MTKDEALNIAIDYMNERLEEHDAKFQRHPVAEAERNNILADIQAVKEALAQPQPWEKFCDSNCVWTDHHPDCKMAEPEQEPVAMKFKIYKPTVPDPMRQGINNALLPWVYDQDRNSGFDATMWVTPVATLPPQRKPLSDEEILTYKHMIDWTAEWSYINFARAIEAAHGIKGEA